MEVTFKLKKTSITVHDTDVVSAEEQIEFAGEMFESPEEAEKQKQYLKRLQREPAKGEC